MELGEKLIDFRLLGADDSYFDTKKIRKQKKIVVFFTCNHCPYVHAYESRIIQMQEDFNHIVQFVGINSNDDTRYPEDSFENMKKRSSAVGYNFPYLRDSSQEIAKVYGASHTPHFYLFNQDRSLIYKGKLDDNWEDECDVKIQYLKEGIKNKDSVPRDTFPVGCSIKWL